MIGIAQAALDHAVRYTKERKQFGKAIADFQGVQFQLARAATDVEAARLLVYNAARLRDAGRPFLTEAAMCKLYASEAAERVASLAVNLFGGYGFVKDYPVEKLYRDAKIGQIYEGTSNLQLQTIAKNAPLLIGGGYRVAQVVGLLRLVVVDRVGGVAEPGQPVQPVNPINLIILGVQRAAEDRGGDDHPLHLRRALVDLCGARVAEQPLDGRSAPVAGGREDLHRLVGGAVRRFRRRQLGHRGLRAPWLRAPSAAAAAFSVSMRAASSSVAISARNH